ncbi:hypothetical protein [Planktosalinus lacus]|uniref:Uncharacterized protein n=1 Tax=Planktosalinus lacus TaxID=1526573 RepID=A0A8J2VAQ6_9FLAO|nr:hypothetical protein [Planktosalinus lacus]GGD93137.1 hypothetical protein GCM10011312_16110 [Planktosalinus lacus]
MEKALIILALVMTALTSAQTSYEQNMQKAFDLWSEGKTEEASAVFERIAMVDNENWLPGYYVALVNTTAAFETTDQAKVENLIGKSQEALNFLKNKHKDNAELLVMQAMIYTAQIAHDPMTNGQKLSGPVMELYGKASAIAPNNPRVVLGKAQFEMGSAQFFGTDTKPICEAIEQSLELFDTFKPESPFHPQWGREQAEESLKNCK